MFEKEVDAMFSIRQPLCNRSLVSQDLLSTLSDCQNKTSFNIKNTTKFVCGRCELLNIKKYEYLVS